MAAANPTPLTAEMLQGFREAHVDAKNREYNSLMKECFEEAMKKISMKDLREQIIKKVTDTPEQDYVEVRVVINIEKLFREKYIYIKDKEGAEKSILNPAGLIECWFTSAARPRDSYSDYCHPFQYKASTRVYTFYKFESENRNEWMEYVYSADPNAQALRKMLRDAFPHAELHPYIFIHSGMEAKFEVAIIYRLPTVIKGAEAATENKRSGTGGWVLW